MLIPSLNTLGFPDWTFAQVIAFAQAHAVPYFEIRGLRGTVDLLALPEFSTSQGVAESARLLQDSGVKLLSLNLGFRLIDDLEPQYPQIRRYAALARDLGAPYLRFFSGGSPAEQPDLDRMARGVEGINALLEGFGARMVIETHDAFVHSADILALNQRVAGGINLLWDIAHTHDDGGETWQETYARLEPLIRYLHIKDTRPQDGRLRNVPLETGNLDVHNLLQFLAQQPAAFIVSLEWEKMWDPSLGPGDLAALDFLQKIQKA